MIYVLLPIDSKKEKITRLLCKLRNKKVLDENGYNGTYEESFKEIWNTLMTEKEKDGYSFADIYHYMSNS